MKNGGIGFGVGMEFNIENLATHLVTITFEDERIIQYKATCFKEDDNDDAIGTLYKIEGGERDYDNYVEISNDESITICEDGEYVFANIVDFSIDGGDFTIDCEDNYTLEQIHIQCDLILGTDESNYEDVINFSTFDLDGNEIEEVDFEEDDDWGDDNEDDEWDKDKRDDDWDEDDEDSASDSSLDSTAPYEVKIIFKDDHIESYYASKEYRSNYSGFTLYLSKNKCIDKTDFVKIDYDAETVYINLGSTYITAELLNISSYNLDDYIICWGGDYYRSISIDSRYKKN